MKHEHSVEVRIPQEVTDTVDTAKKHFETNKQAYLFGLSGLVIGVVGSRVFSRAPVQIIINNITD